MEPKYNTRKWSNRVRAKDENPSSTEPADQQGSYSNVDTTKQYAAPSQTASRHVQPSQPEQGYSSKYHFGHDELDHPDEMVRPEE
ncbi:hypothetical protein ABOM_003938 [Aspergillus bombycis]|uniref:Uncharacterized protein n=1 Tax=Aspergillus bombycis TaxID=109264 RepID=A0A1F8A664_9EURO|nr:hypothetical protein ABOM_003938 [Aspergillus bombycis]OGM47242.1 hypothetical protein ABOM_003938 [Aspergillus bombycis]